jgi:hypothetical protein
MPSDRKLMQMALDAFESFESATDGLYKGEFAEERKALQERLAQPEPWVKTYCGGKPNYTAPPKREWVGLTEDEFEEVLAKYNEALPVVVCRAIEAKLKEKNT